MKGTRPFPSSFTMSQETQIQAVENLLQPLLDEDCFLVSIKIKPTNNIKVYLDADHGLPIEKCIKINRALYRIMEEQGMYPDGDFSLEVSSPGLDEPLKLLRQYKKNVGREVELTMNDDSKKEGRLINVNEDGISIGFVEGKGKKAVSKEEEVPFSDIRQTRIKIKF